MEEQRRDPLGDLQRSALVVGDELVGQQQRRRGSLRRVFLETAESRLPVVDEVSQLETDAGVGGDFDVRRVADVLDGVDELRAVREGDQAESHLVDDDSERPDVGGVGVLLAEDALGAPA